MLNEMKDPVTQAGDRILRCAQDDMFITGSQNDSQEALTHQVSSSSVLP